MTAIQLHPLAHRQRGVTLIELMVGITIGLFTVAVALGALMASRSVSGTVSDVSQIQQEAAYIFRTIGQQVRQAGSLKLNMASNQPEDIDPSAILPTDPVAFETTSADFDPRTKTISGTETSLTTGFRGYLEELNAFSGPGSLQSDCMGQKKTATASLVESIFSLNTPTNELRCTGFQDGTSQPMSRNIANFQVRYLVQTAAGSGNPQVQYVNATSVDGNWARVFGVEVCVVLYGNEVINLSPGSTYTDCDGTSVTLDTLAAPRNNRMHMVFRNVYQLRPQGLIGSVL